MIICIVSLSLQCFTVASYGMSWHTMVIKTVFSSKNRTENRGFQKTETEPTWKTDEKNENRNNWSKKPKPTQHYLAPILT